MVRYVIKRLLWIVPVILGVAILIFTLMYFTPGDPAAIILGSDATQLELDAQREAMGLNDPYIEQLGRFLRDVFLKGDFGRSYITNVEISQELAERLPRTVIIGVFSLLISMVIGVLLGIVAAIHRNGIADRLCMLIALVGVSMPQFWLGLMLVIVFSLRLHWLPNSGIGSPAHYILPCMAGSFGGIAEQARQTRSSMLEVIRSDYITTARAKGLPFSKVIFKHALPNALLPVLTLAGNTLAHVVSGSVVLETVFGIPGAGMYMISAVNNRDYPVVRACVILIAIIFGLTMLLLDIIYAFVDPKIKARYQKTAKVKAGGK